MGLVIAVLAGCGGGGGGGGPSTKTLTVTKGGYGDGAIAAAGAALTCDPFKCTFGSTASPTLTLTATPRANSTFQGWSGACTGTGSCVVTLGANQDVTATFDWVTTGTDRWHEQNLGRQPVDYSSYVSTTTSAGAFPLYASATVAPLVVSTAASGEYEGVVLAVNSLATDLGAVTDHTPTVTGTPAAGTLPVIIGTLGHSAVVDGLVAAGKLPEAAGITGKWETWITKVVDAPVAGVTQALIIAGSDQRGTIYGVYDLSRNIGVSPWYFWDDVTPAKKSALYVSAGVHTLGTPAVKYRGFFINDEAPELTSWWGIYGRTSTFNKEIYKRFFELALRLRANIVWPAVWGKAFDDDAPDNHLTAKQYGVVIGMSHEAPMDRGIEEWNRHFSEYGATAKADWSYRTHPDAVRAYWKAGVDRMVANGFEDVVTVGMRGTGDTALTDGVALPLMEQIQADERRIIADSTGKEPDQTPQNWILYSEVQGYWDNGLRAPADVTVTFCDDDFGSIRDLPKLDDEPRSGGYGIYYHVDFVGPVRSYMWVDTNLVANIWEQMNQAYTYGVDRLWVVNGGDVKSNERPIQFFIDLAWSPENWNQANLSDWQTAYAAQNFGATHAAEVADVLHQYERLQSRRKPELLNALYSYTTANIGNPPVSAASPFSLVNYRELERVVAEWGALRTQAEALGALLAPEQQDAYFQLVLYAIQGGENAYRLRLAQFRNLLYATQGRASALDWGTTANLRFKDATGAVDYTDLSSDDDLKKKYDTIAGGKWKSFQNQAKFAYVDWTNLSSSDSIKPNMATTVNLQAGKDWGFAIDGSSAWWGAGPAGTYLVGTSTTATNGAAPSTDTPVLPQVTPYSTSPAPYIEVFTRGATAVTFTITSDDSAVTVSPATGTVDATTKEIRAQVSVDWAAVAAGTSKTVHLTVAEAGGWSEDVELPILKPATAPSNTAFVESGGYVSIEAMHARVVDKAPISWVLIPDIGRTESGYTPFPQTSAAQTPAGGSPRLEFDVQLYTVSAASPVTVWVYASPRNNVLGSRPAADSGIRYAASFDDAAPQIVNITQQTGAKDFALSAGTTFFNTSGWGRNAADNIAATYSTHALAAGAHTLKIWMVDPTVIVQKVVIDTGGLKYSLLGPPESWNASLH
jgi:hypothetical protein